MTQKREHSEKESGEALAAGASGGMKTGRSGDFGGPLYRKHREYSDSDYIQFYKEGDSGTDASSDTPITENDVLDYLEECLTDPDFYKHHIELLYLCYYIDQES